MVIHIQKKECTTVLSLSLMVLKIFFLSDMPKIDLWSIKKDQMEKFHKFYRKVGQ